MSQLQKTLDSGEGSASGLEGLRAKFASVKATKVPEVAKFRIMNIKLVVSCGCGGSFTEAHVVIPNDFNADHVEGRIRSQISSRGKIYDDDLQKIVKDYSGVSVNKGYFNGNPMEYDPNNHANLF